MTSFKKKIFGSDKRVDISIRQKILFTFFLSGLLVILISSGMYYYLLVKDIRARGHHHIKTAFDMMFNDLNSTIKHSADRINRFTQDTLSIHMFVLSVSQNQLKQMQDIQSWERWRSVQEIISRLRSMGEATAKSASLLEAVDIRIYDNTAQLMVLYQNRDQAVQGIYLPHAHEGTFLPLRTIDDKSWYWQGIEDIPQNSLPGGVPVTYPDDIPDAFKATLSRLDDIATIRFIVPILKRDKMQGFCVIHVRLSQDDIERYSRYSQSYVNIFVGSALSLGTLPVYNEFPTFCSEPLYEPEISGSIGIPESIFSEIEIKSQHYYQGKVSFGYADKDIITVTANFPHRREVEKAEKLTIPIIIMILVLGLLMTVILAFLLQIILIRPLNIILRTANAVAEGKLAQEIQISSHDEIGKLADAFRHMKNIIENVLHDMEQIIEAIQSGKLDIQGNADAYSGSWQDLIVGTNSVIDAFVSPLRMTATCLGRISKGDIPEKINDEYKGDFDEIRNNLNLLIDATLETTHVAEEIADGNIGVEVRERSEQDRMMKALNQMIRRLNEIMNETNSMIRAVGQGRLDVRGNAGVFEGGWQNLVSGVNDLIDGLSNAVSKSAVLRQEMELARKIQTSLLPTLTDKMHPDFEIAATMIPADEVGGDFYDISFDGSGNLWFAIGDVSGHGVTPGLIMMMAQTIHATVTTALDCSTRDAVIKINKVLYNNVHERLKEKHFMTFNALKYLGKGKFEHAGVHLRIIVYRRKLDKCELIRTKGVYLNLKEDISRATINSCFELEKGDIMILYTDGLTEAENPDCEMIDIDGFIDIVERHAHLEPAAMQESIMADVLEWCNNKRNDDMTLVIAKKKGDSDA